MQKLADNDAEKLGKILQGMESLLPGIASLLFLGSPRISSFRGPESPTCPLSFLGARERWRKGWGPWIIAEMLGKVSNLPSTTQTSLENVFQAPKSSKVLGKRRPGHQKSVTGFNGEALPGGVPGPNRAGRGSLRARTVLEVCLYMHVARDGRWGGFSRGSVLLVVPGIR